MAIERERTYRLNFPTTPVFKGCWAPHEAERTKRRKVPSRRCIGFTITTADYGTE